MNNFGDIVVLSEKEIGQNIKLNLGCGLCTPPDWFNIDNSITASLSKIPLLYKLLAKLAGIKPIPWSKNIKIIDLRKKFPFQNDSVSAIFSSHFIEHLNLTNARFVMQECHRCLHKSGVIRIIVPDLYQMAKKYMDMVSAEPTAERSQTFLKELGLMDETLDGIKGFFYRLFSHSQHLYMYDKWSLANLLGEAGFHNIESKVYGNSRIQSITSIETKARHQESICLEAIKG